MTTLFRVKVITNMCPNYFSSNDKSKPCSELWTHWINLNISNYDNWTKTPCIDYVMKKKVDYALSYCGDPQTFQFSTGGTFYFSYVFMLDMGDWAISLCSY